MSLDEVLHLHQLIRAHSGGAAGVRDANALKSALSQPFVSFDGEELYPTLIDKAAILCISLIGNHPFVDGNKRVGHAAMEVLLVLNGYEVRATVDEQEMVILAVAAGELSREEFTDWLRAHVEERDKA